MFSYGPDGAILSTAVASYNTFPYDPRERKWYEDAAAAETATWCSLFPVSPVVPPATIPGLSYATPFYSASDELIGVCASDIDSTLVNEALAPLGAADMSTVVYAVESDTLYLLGSSIGEHSGIENNEISSVRDADNWVIRKSARAVIDGSTFRADGSYTVAADSDGSALCVQLKTYLDDVSGTTGWKVVAAVQSSSCGAEYTTPLSEVAVRMMEEVTNILRAVESLPRILNFQSGSDIFAPLDAPILDTSEPGLDSLSRQSTWAVAHSSAHMHPFLVSCARCRISTSLLTAVSTGLCGDSICIRRNLSGLCVH